MSEEEKYEVKDMIREYLKKNLKIKVKMFEDENSIGVKVQLVLEGEVIAQSFNKLHEEEQGWF